MAIGSGKKMKQPPTPTIGEILEAYLVTHRFDGLWNNDADCACVTDHLFPCGEPNHEHCRPGWKSKCDCGEHDFHIGARR